MNNGSTTNFPVTLEPRAGNLLADWVALEMTVHMGTSWKSQICTTKLCQRISLYVHPPLLMRSRLREMCDQRLNLSPGDLWTNWHARARANHQGTTCHSRALPHVKRHVCQRHFRTRLLLYSTHPRTSTPVRTVRLQRTVNGEGVRLVRNRR